MSKNFNEVLKERDLNGVKEENEMSLDSTERIKVLSPGQMVFKRFVTNRLAIAGTVILLFMFIFSFIVPVFYPYGQTQIFYKYDNSVIDYAQASKRTDYSVLYEEGAPEIHYFVKNNLTATIKDMKSSGLTEALLSDPEGNSFRLEENTDQIYSLYMSDKSLICTISGETKYATYNPILSKLAYEAGVEEIEGFETAITKAIDSGKTEFKVNGEWFSLAKEKKIYTINKEGAGAQYEGKALGEDFEALVTETGVNGSFEFKNTKYSVVTKGDVTSVYKLAGETKIAILTTLVFDAYDAEFTITDEFKRLAIDAIISEGKFSADGEDYTVKAEEDAIIIYNSANAKVSAISDLVIRRYSGEDDLSYAFKEAVREVIDDMDSKGSKTSSFTWQIAQVDENGAYTYDENGNLIEEEREVSITNKNGSYTLTVLQVVYLIDTFALPSKEHIAGTDGDGMDVFARMMYGGRVSLLVAFVVIILETVLGVIMGGVAGFFGGFIDNLIMRMVDIFYCIPTMPILIILGALFDALKLKPYTRVMWLMAVLGVLGWAGVARLVRGQILSLREQEFMVAAEAIGLRTKRRIFKHLVPNVMPQLIVTATSGLGSIILTESTLSFLGLGVKHPLATWGTMINSVSTAEAMKAYTYIWVPVGLLICLTVVAFNFVGDGLRDAFDPKMKR